MIDPAQFAERLEIWLDGELPPDEAAEMEAFCAAHPDARARADAERAFDARVRQALLAAPTAPTDARSGSDSVMAALATARRTAGVVPAVQAPPPVADRPESHPSRARLLTFPKWVSGTAAVLGLAAMWMNCIPPFECPYVEALEAAASAPSDGSAELDGLTRERVSLQINVPFLTIPSSRALRTRVPVDGGEAVLLMSESPGHRPSFRRERKIDGETWWIASENGQTLVAFEDPGNRGLWCFVGPEAEATLVSAARKLRTGLAAPPK
ncbi:MAG: hypothetical protein K8T90_11370 [Planctomycetes bacterium]|nr:hypothetical protein [Planctomycetota bacterium]